MKLTRRKLLKMGGFSAAGLMLSGGAAYGYGRRIEIERYEITQVPIAIPGLPPAFDGYRIVLLSDFHLYPHVRLEYLQRVFGVAAGFRPDLIVLTGDFVQAGSDAIFDLAPALASMDARDGLFAVLGNHDLWEGGPVVRAGLEAEGIPVLSNQGLALARGGQRLYLAGVDDALAGAPDLAAAMEGWDGEKVVLLSHAPDIADRFSRDPRVSLQLSGHSHGGQVRFPLIGSPFCPPLGRKYDLGLYRVGQMQLYTNRGIGVTVPIRINCRPELTEVTLHRG
jgi:uncharacterized protein